MGRERFVPARAAAACASASASAACASACASAACASACASACVCLRPCRRSCAAPASPPHCTLHTARGTRRRASRRRRREAARRDAPWTMMLGKCCATRTTRATRPRLGLGRATRTAPGPGLFGLPDQDPGAAELPELSELHSICQASSSKVRRAARPRGGGGGLRGGACHVQCAVCSVGATRGRRSCGGMGASRRKQTRMQTRKPPTRKQTRKPPTR